MRVEWHTLYDEDFQNAERFFSDETKAKIIEASQSVYGSYYDMPFSQFWSCLNSKDFSFLGSCTTVFSVYWLVGFGDFIEDFTKQIQKLSVKPSADELRASSGLLQTSFFENTLVFLQKYFGLSSFVEAERITIGELLIAKRDSYNTERFKRNYSDIMIQKSKLKK